MCPCDQHHSARMYQFSSYLAYENDLYPDYLPPSPTCVSRTSCKPPAFLAVHRGVNLPSPSAGSRAVCTGIRDLPRCTKSQSRTSGLGTLPAYHYHLPNPPDIGSYHLLACAPLAGLPPFVPSPFVIDQPEDISSQGCCWIVVTATGCPACYIHPAIQAVPI